MLNFTDQSTLQLLVCNDMFHAVVIDADVQSCTIHVQTFCLLSFPHC